MKETNQINKNSINGLLLVDKPENLSSYDIIRILKKKLKTNKIGHCGTLDPFASGLLALCFGNFTKISSFIENQSKTYIAKALLGIETDTFDKTGKIINKNPVNIEKKDIFSILNDFKGEIDQTPPKFSAIHINGHRAYELARKGINVELKPRKVFISEIKLIDFTPPYFEFLLSCAKGTYIRSLASDIGKKLKCGCHLVELRRIKIGNFDIKNSISIDSPEKIIINSLLNLDEALSSIPDAIIKENYESYIKYGKKLEIIFFENDFNSKGLYKIKNQENKILAIVEYENSNLKYKKVFLN